MSVIPSFHCPKCGKTSVAERDEDGCGVCPHCPAPAPATREPDDSAAVLSRFIGMVRALLRHTNPFNVNEGHAQQWMAVNDECDKLERAAPPARCAATTVEPVAAALARRLCQMFDSGGESQRSARARHASALFQMLNRDDPRFAAEQAKCDADPVGYLEACEGRAAAPTTSPGPLEDTREALSADLEKVQFELDAALLRIAELDGDDPPEPSAIFHATGLAGERLARITSPEPDAVRDIKEALQEAREHLVTAFDAPSMKQRINSALWSIKQAETHLASLSAPVAGTWPKPIAEAPRDADEILLVSFQEQGPNGLVYISLNNACWDEAQKCFVLGPRGCSTNAVGDGHSTHWLPRSWLPDVAATRNDRVTSQPSKAECCNSCGRTDAEYIMSELPCGDAWHREDDPRHLAAALTGKESTNG